MSESSTACSFRLVSKCGWGSSFGNRASCYYRSTTGTGILLANRWKMEDEKGRKIRNDHGWRLGDPVGLAIELDVSFPTTDGRRLVMPRYTEPSPDQALLLHHLTLALPQHPPPRITTPASTAPCSQLKM